MKKQKEIYITPPKGVKACANFTGAIMGVINVYMALGLKGLPSFCGIMLTYQFSFREINALFAFVRDVDDLPLNLPEKRPHIELSTYHTALLKIAQMLYNTELPLIIKDTVAFIDPNVVQKTIDTLIKTKCKDSTELKDFLKDSLMAYKHF